MSTENKDEKVMCVCGSNFLKRNIKQHEKTKKHLDFVACTGTVPLALDTPLAPSDQVRSVPTQSFVDPLVNNILEKWVIGDIIPPLTTGDHVVDAIKQMEYHMLSVLYELYQALPEDEIVEEDDEDNEKKC